MTINGRIMRLDIGKFNGRIEGFDGTFYFEFSGEDQELLKFMKQCFLGDQLVFLLGTGGKGSVDSPLKVTELRRLRRGDA